MLLKKKHTVQQYMNKGRICGLKKVKNRTSSAHRSFYTDCVNYRLIDQLFVTNTHQKVPETHLLTIILVYRR